MAPVAQPLHERDTLIGDECARIAALHVAGAVGGELHTQAPDLLVAYFLFRSHPVTRGIDGVAVPAKSFKMDGAALFSFD